MTKAQWAAALAFAGLTVTSEAAAQVTVSARTDLPEYDRCDNLAGTGCPISGTRTVTTVSETYTPAPAQNGVPQVRLSGIYDVDFNGSNFSSFAPVIYSARYRGTISNAVVPAYVVAPGADPILFQDFENVRYNVAAMSFQTTGTLLGTRYSISSAPGAPVFENGVALSGRFVNTDRDSAIVYGRMDGFARIEPYLDPQPGGAFHTALQLVYNAVPTVTTRLDENGLLTPRITVTDGIDMSGSRIDNLAAGIADGDAVNVQQLKGEAALRAAGDAALAAAINTEAATRAAADTQLAAGLAAEAQTRAAADTQLATAISTEAATRAAADTQLAAGLAAEAQTRAAGDAQLATAINTEAATRAAADTQLANGLTAEAQTRAAADTQLATAINTEAATRAAAVTQLANGLGAEAQTRAAGDAQLATAINAEAATRAANDVQLAQGIDTEARTRAAADQQMSQRISAGEVNMTALASQLAAETSARMTADMALSSRMDALDGRLDRIDSRLDRVENRVASGTAVAIALGGNAFLPDTRFNLTANVATYDGAHAGAVQFGAMITDRVAINGGVATGFNRRGRAGARAGVTIGW